jgi:hypothetical protein
MWNTYVNSHQYQNKQYYSYYHNFQLLDPHYQLFPNI